MRPPVLRLLAGSVGPAVSGAVKGLSEQSELCGFHKGSPCAGRVHEDMPLLIFGVSYSDPSSRRRYLDAIAIALAKASSAPIQQMRRHLVNRFFRHGSIFEFTIHEFIAGCRILVDFDNLSGKRLVGPRLSSFMLQTNPGHQLD